MSDTPRTDEQEFGSTADAMVVDASFARELERENIKLKRENQRYWGDREAPFKLFSGKEFAIRVYDSIGHTVISAYSMEQIERLSAEAKLASAQLELEQVKKQLGDFKSAFESASKIKFEAEVALTAARERIAVLESKKEMP